MAEYESTDPIPLAYQIELNLTRIETTPDNLKLHQQLRVTALRYKAAGGRPAGMLDRCKLPRDPLERMLHMERLWSLDPGNRSYIPKLLAAMSAVERAKTPTNFAPIRRWLYQMLEGPTEH